MGEPSSGTKRRKTVEEMLDFRDASEDELPMSSDIEYNSDETDEVPPQDIAPEQPEEDDVERLKSENRMLLTLIAQQKEQISTLNWTINDLRDTVKSLQFTIKAAFPDKEWEDKSKQQPTSRHWGARSARTTLRQRQHQANIDRSFVLRFQQSPQQRQHSEDPQPAIR
ncbi:unnamed protein product [Hermetia illucens]|uniref:Uncharacterized protein n=1 Tax=Hermetia illucens TaxID=343691 RepID=A0A7R8V2I9_HERIL|nr:unnamed protein product [Hermetia illucens]